MQIPLNKRTPAFAVCVKGRVGVSLMLVCESEAAARALADEAGKSGKPATVEGITITISPTPGAVPERQL